MALSTRENQVWPRDVLAAGCRIGRPPIVQRPRRVKFSVGGRIQFGRQQRNRCNTGRRGESALIRRSGDGPRSGVLILARSHGWRSSAVNLAAPARSSRRLIGRVLSPVIGPVPGRDRAAPNLRTRGARARALLRATPLRNVPFASKAPVKGLAV
jgi:hypothetical protein